MNSKIKSNKDLPIIEKSMDRVVKIALAKMTRSYDLDNSKWTQFWSQANPNHKEIIQTALNNPNEQAILLTWIDESNWTLLTSHFIRGKFDGKEIKSEICKIKDYDFGVAKGLDGNVKELIVKMKGPSKKLIYETNAPGFMLMYGLDILHNHWKRKAIKK